MHVRIAHVPTRGLLLILLCAMTVAAGFSQTTISFKQYTLPNGLTVVLREDHSAPVAAVMVMYHVGSKNEKPKRTGFAHLFEHVMFKGSEHLADGEHFKQLQEIGAAINGSTTQDRTNYFEAVPSNYLELALYMESDRMGFLLPAVTQAKLDNQRDVVKNERRQNYDNQPYGTVYERISRVLYPADHPYSWPVIGYMEDLSAASLEDVKDFFRTYYAPNNACVVISGDFKEDQVRGWVEKYFGPIPRGKDFERPKKWPVTLSADKRIAFEDKVQLPRLMMVWPSAPYFSREDAVLDVLTDILSRGKNSLLYKALVFDQQIAQSASAGEDGSEIAGEMTIDVTAKPGKSLKEIEAAVDIVIKKLLDDGVTEKQIHESINAKEAQLVNTQQTALGVAGTLATYWALSGDPGNFNKEMQRYENITPAEVLAAAKKIFSSHKVILSAVPEGKMELAAQEAGK